MSLERLHATSLSADSKDSVAKNPRQKNKFILDATAGFRMIWNDKHHPNTLFIDNCPDCNPDEIQDFRQLPYADESFYLIVFDPPHSIEYRKVQRLKDGFLREKYGVLSPETWQDDLKRGFAELWRVLKPNGILIFKWGEHDKTAKELRPLFPCEPLFEQKGAAAISRSSNDCSTIWFCFMKIPQENEKK